jgi:hypothetical protein
MKSKNSHPASGQLGYWWTGLRMFWARTQADWIVVYGHWWGSQRRKGQN